MIVVHIPHHAPVRCLADHAVVIPEGIIVQALVQADSPGAQSGMVRPGWLIEVAAQACAAAGAVESPDGGRSGLLVGVKDWHWYATVPIERTMSVQVIRTASLGLLAEYRCTISNDDRCVAEGIVVVMRR